MNINNLKILTWNLTTNSIIYKGWRQNFGLYYPEEVHNLNYNQSYYQRIHIFKYINSLRLKNIVNNIKKYNPHILLLHGISDDTIINFNNKTIQEYISDILDYTIISTKYNKNIEIWDLPPFEQILDKKNIKSKNGVSMLLSNKVNFVIDKTNYKLNISRAYNFKRLLFLDGEFTILNIDIDINDLEDVIKELNNKNIDLNKILIVAKNKNNLIAISHKFTFKNLKINLPILKTNINDGKYPERWKNYWNNQKNYKDKSLVNFTLNNYKNNYTSNISKSNYKILTNCYSFTGLFKPILITDLKQI